MTERRAKIAIDSDDAAVELKKTIFDHLNRKGIDITDLDYMGFKNVSYPAIGYNLACKIRDGIFDKGILICGTGLGMAIIANKVEGVYAGVCHDVYSAQRLRMSNDAQVITMGARVIGPELAKIIVDAWLGAEFAGGTSRPKVELLRKLEKQSFHPSLKPTKKGIQYAEVYQ